MTDAASTTTWIMRPLSAFLVWLLFLLVPLLGFRWTNESLNTLGWWLQLIFPLYIIAAIWVHSDRILSKILLSILAGVGMPLAVLIAPVLKERDTILATFAYDNPIKVDAKNSVVVAKTSVMGGQTTSVWLQQRTEVFPGLERRTWLQKYPCAELQVTVIDANAVSCHTGHPLWGNLVPCPSDEVVRLKKD